MSRGFVFSIDAFLALIIAATFLAALASMDRPDVHAADVLRLARNAQDAAAILQDNGTLDSVLSQSDAAAAVRLDQALDAVLPPGLTGRADVDVYEYRVGVCGTCSLDGPTPSDGFCHCRSLNTSFSPANRSSSVLAMRQAYNNSAPTMTRVRVTVWSP